MNKSQVCIGKVPLADVEAAEIAIKSMSKKFPNVEFKHYICPHCENYHLTSNVSFNQRK